MAKPTTEMETICQSVPVVDLVLTTPLKVVMMQKQEKRGGKRAERVMPSGMQSDVSIIASVLKPSTGQGREAPSSAPTSATLPSARTPWRTP